jgi:hypothetical protein
MWWFLLYWPIMIAVIFFGVHYAERYPKDSSARRRVEIALGCVLIGMPAAPLLIAVGWVIVHNIRDTAAQVALVVGSLSIGSALIFGALVNYTWARTALDRIRTLLSPK